MATNTVLDNNTGTQVVIQSEIDVNRRRTSALIISNLNHPSVIETTDISITNNNNNNTNTVNLSRRNSSRIQPFNDRIRSVFQIIRTRFNNPSPVTSKKKSTTQSSSSAANFASTSGTNNLKKKRKSNRHQTTTMASTSVRTNTSAIQSNIDDPSIQKNYCELCCLTCLETDQADTNYMFNLNTCEHSFCINCLRQYLKYQITESRVSISCPQCNEKMHPNDIYCLLSSSSNNNINKINRELSLDMSSSSTSSSSSMSPKTNVPLIKHSSEENKTDNDTPAIDNSNKLLEENWPHLIQKYEEFMLRRVLVTIQDIRWCPAPDCTYAVIASGCASCPQLYCMRPNCNTCFCYHCKQYWHPNLTCEDAALKNDANNISSSNKLIRSFLQRSNSHISTSSSNGAINLASLSNVNNKTNGTNGTAASITAVTTRSTTGDLLKEEIKRCPKCQALIVKMDDGSCNHITCSVCGCEFCWLCMKEISDLHYLSPSGCTFWGKKPWSRKKKILWQLGTLIGAPVGIALIAGVAVPAILIGLPIWAGRKVYVRYKSMTRSKRNIIVVSTVMGTIVVAPLVAALAVGIGVPILLAYVYGVVPISLCRSGGCGVTTNNNGGVRFAFDDETPPETTAIAANNQQLFQPVAKNQTSSVTIPISAIEPKPDDSIVVSSNNQQDLSTIQQQHHQTPVLITITMANKLNNTSTTITNNKYTTTTATSTANNSTMNIIPNKISPRLLSSISSGGSGEPVKSNKLDSASTNTSVSSSSSISKKKSITSNVALNGSVSNKCGSVENNLHQDHTTISSQSKEIFDSNGTNVPILKSIAAETETGTAISSIRNYNNKFKIVNPSIGDMSIGTFTQCSLSASGSYLYDENDDQSIKENNSVSAAVGGAGKRTKKSTKFICNINEKIANEEEYAGEEEYVDYELDADSIKRPDSMKVLTSVLGSITGSITKTDTNTINNNNNNNSIAIIDEKNTTKMNTNTNTNTTTTTESNLKSQCNVNDCSKSNYSYDKNLDNKDTDTFSISIMSEKSINPSVAALAGSIK